MCVYRCCIYQQREREKRACTRASESARKCVRERAREREISVIKVVSPDLPAEFLLNYHQALSTRYTSVSHNEFFPRLKPRPLQNIQTTVFGIEAFFQATGRKEKKKNKNTFDYANDKWPFTYQCFCLLEFPCLCISLCCHGNSNVTVRVVVFSSRNS